MIFKKCNAVDLLRYIKYNYFLNKRDLLKIEVVLQTLRNGGGKVFLNPVTRLVVLTQN